MNAIKIIGATAISTSSRAGFSQNSAGVNAIGSTGNPFLQAANQGLLQAYLPKTKKLPAPKCCAIGGKANRLQVPTNKTFKLDARIPLLERWRLEVEALPRG